MSDAKINHDPRLYLWSYGIPGGEMRKINYDKLTGEHKPLTKHQFVNWSVRVNEEKRPEIFKIVPRSHFLDEMRSPLESQYLRMLGWSYCHATRTAISQGGIVLYTCHPDAVWRFVGFDDFERDEEIALDVIRTLDECLGDVLVMEEYVELDY